MLGEFSNKILPYITELTEYKFGLFKESALITNVSERTDLNYENGHNSFLFTLAGHRTMIKWQFTFDLDNMDIPPEVISEDNFYLIFNITFVKKVVPSLGAWNPNNSKCLLKLVLELLRLFQHFQLDVLHSHDALKGYRHHYESLKRVMSTPDIEMEIFIKNPRQASIQFSIGLKFDVSNMPICQTEAKGHVIWLTVDFESTEARPTIKVKVHDRLDELIDVPKKYDEEMAIRFEDIVQYFQLTVEHQIKNFRHLFQRRREVFKILMNLVDVQVLEVDDDMFTKLSFHVNEDTKNFVCVLDVPVDDADEEANLIIIKGAPHVITSLPFYDETEDCVYLATVIFDQFLKNI